MRSGCSAAWRSSSCIPVPTTRFNPLSDCSVVACLDENDKFKLNSHSPRQTPGFPCPEASAGCHSREEPVNVPLGGDLEPSFLQRGEYGFEVLPDELSASTDTHAHGISHLHSRLRGVSDRQNLRPCDSSAEINMNRDHSSGTLYRVRPDALARHPGVPWSSACSVYEDLADTTVGNGRSKRLADSDNVILVSVRN